MAAWRRGCPLVATVEGELTVAEAVAGVDEVLVREPEGAEVVEDRHVFVSNANLLRVLEGRGDADSAI